MAVCEACGLEMTDPATRTCVAAEIEFADGASLAQVPYEPDDEDERCGSCKVVAGGLHHPGCDMEECPRCGEQMIACGCDMAEDEDDEA